MGDPDKPQGLSPRFSPEERELFRRLANARFGRKGNYILAREEAAGQYTGPDWMPFNLWQTAEYDRGLEGDCARTLGNGAGAEKLWAAITARYHRTDSIALSLPSVCADAKARWRVTPRATPSEYREQREKLSRNAEQLAVELERFYVHRDPDAHEFPGMLDFAELMTQPELDRLDEAIRYVAWGIASRALSDAGQTLPTWGEYNAIGEKARALGYSDDDLVTPAREAARAIYGLMQRDHVTYMRRPFDYGGVPTLPDLLRRIAGKFAEDGQDAPIARPNLANAERNFFTRALCKYFWTSFGDVSPAIVRDVVCMFYPQGIDENEVSQMAAKVREAHPLPNYPETSRPIS